MAKRKKAKKLKKREMAAYREVAARALKRIEAENPDRRVGFLVHDDAAVELAASQKYVWVDAKVLLRVKRVKYEKPGKWAREAPALAPVPHHEEATA
jgi:hypothetical protein